MPSTREQHDRMRQSPLGPQPTVPKVIVDNDGPPSTGVWQNGGVGTIELPIPGGGGDE